MAAYHSSNSSNLVGKWASEMLSRYENMDSNPPGLSPSSSLTGCISSDNIASRHQGVVDKLTEIYSPKNAKGVANNHSNLERKHKPLGSKSRSASTSKIISQPPCDIIRFENSHAWRTYFEVRIYIYKLPLDITIREIHDSFEKLGNVTYVEVFEDTGGIRNGKGLIIMSPPPPNPIWNEGRFIITRPMKPPIACPLALDAKFRVPQHPSPVDPRIRYPEVMALYASSLEVGVLLGENKMLAIRSILPSSSTEISFRLNLKHRELVIEFTLRIRDWRHENGNLKRKGVGRYDRDDRYKLTLPLSHLKAIDSSETKSRLFSICFSLDTPPRYFKKTVLHDPAGRSKRWQENDMWYRQTDVTYSPHGLKNLPITLKKSHPIIDIGYWTTYHLVLEQAKNDMPTLQRIRNALHDYNVSINSLNNLEVVRGVVPPIWEHMGKSSVPHAPSKATLTELLHHQGPILSFAVRYQLEVCISHGYLGEFCMDRCFVDKLVSMDSTKARDLLEFTAHQKQRIFDPSSIFNMAAVPGSTSQSMIPAYCTLIRSVTITPTRIYIHTPTVETSNRVIRQYAEYADHFLRIHFADENTKDRVFPNPKGNINEIYTRFKRAMTNGISIAGRHYDFLAFGNSQFREHGAYFFAPIGDLNAYRIRSWMGHFKDIRIVAKHASRLGQCFSTTRAVGNARANIIELQDIVRNGYTFTDGVGRISRFLGDLIAEELGLLSSGQETPSLFQFRLGGCKGVLAIDPNSKARDLHIRPSQYKFPASHEGLEVISWSRYTSARLNRQLVLVLSSLGVQESVFRRMQYDQLSELQGAMTNSSIALKLLQKYVDHNQMSLTMASMILDGFHASREPFMASLLRLWRSWSVKSLKEKASISVERGAILLGCVDETATLHGHFNGSSLPRSYSSLLKGSSHIPEVFVQLSRDPEKPGLAKSKVIVGPMLIARNPSLHPGDIRVVQGVDVPHLRHLKDVVVLPQTGDRDIASMCSGGDLDGDDFVVIWDHRLFPTEWNQEPMDYRAPKPAELDRNVTVDDLTTFFITYMRNDSLAAIAHAHVAWADRSEMGVKDQKCLKLASLHSQAVDFPKTGEAAQMSPDLRVRLWPHFMEKTHLPKEQIYVSTKVLGKLYDDVERIDFMPTYETPFDQRILGAYDFTSETLDQVRSLKQQYDTAVLRIMAQHQIKTEFEVWSTFVLSHSKRVNDYKFHEQIGQISMALKDQYRGLCFKVAGVKGQDQIGPFAAAMYKITADEVTNALKYRNQTQSQESGRVAHTKPITMPFMSFPWLFNKVLGKIARNELGRGVLPQTSLQVSSASENTLQMRKTNAILPTAIKIIARDPNIDLDSKAGATTTSGTVSGQTSERLQDPQRETRCEGEMERDDRVNEYIKATNCEDVALDTKARRTLCDRLAAFGENVREE